MFCKILKHHSWEPEVEVTHSLIVLFILLRIGPIEVGIEAISLRPQCRYDTIRYDAILCYHVSVGQGAAAVSKMQFRLSSV